MKNYQVNMVHQSVVINYAKQTLLPSAFIETGAPCIWQ